MEMRVLLAYISLALFPDVYGGSLDAVSYVWNHSRYMLIRVPQDFYTSRTTCLDHGMDLAVITNAQEQSFVAAIIR